MTLLVSGSVRDGSTITLDTTGAQLIVTGQVCHGAVNADTLTDSKNTLTNLTEHGAILTEGPRHSIRISYKLAPVVGTGHVFSRLSGANGSFGALAFSELATAFDVEGFHDSTVGSTTNAAGSVTPTTGTSLIVAAYGIDDPANTGSPQFQIDSSFTIAEFKDVVVGSTHGIVIAYKYVTGTSAVNPVLTRSNANTQSGDAAVIAVFKIPAGGGGVVDETESGLLTFSRPIVVDDRTVGVWMRKLERERRAA